MVSPATAAACTMRSCSRWERRSNGRHSGAIASSSGGSPASTIPPSSGDVTSKIVATARKLTTAPAPRQHRSATPAIRDASEVARLTRSPGGTRSTPPRGSRARQPTSCCTISSVVSHSRPAIQCRPAAAAASAIPTPTSTANPPTSHATHPRDAEHRTDRHCATLRAEHEPEHRPGRRGADERAPTGGSGSLRQIISYTARNQLVPGGGDTLGAGWWVQASLRVVQEGRFIGRFPGPVSRPARRDGKRQNWRQDDDPERSAHQCSPNTYPRAALLHRHCVSSRIRSRSSRTSFWACKLPHVNQCAVSTWYA